MTMQKDVPDRTPYEGRFMPSGRGRTWMGTPTCDVAAYMGKTESNLLISLDGDRPGKPDADLLYCDAPDDLTGSRMSRIRRTKLVSHRCVKWMIQTCRASDKAGWKAIEAAFPFKRRQGGHGEAIDGPEDDQIDLEGVSKRVDSNPAPSGELLERPIDFNAYRFRKGTLNGKPCIVAKDIVAAIGGQWSGSDANHVPGKWRGLATIQTSGGPQEMVCLLREGINFYLMRSDNPNALPLQEFVCGVVLPEIQDTGSYGAPKVMSDDELLNRAYLLAHERYKKAEAAIETEWKPKVHSLERENAKAEQARLQAEDVADRERVAREAAEADKAKMAPKVEYFDDLVDRAGLYSYSAAAKMLEVGRSYLITILFNPPLNWHFRYNGRGELQPHKKAITDRYMAVQSRSFTNKKTGEPDDKETARITEKGIEFLRQYLKRPFKLVS